MPQNHLARLLRGAVAFLAVTVVSLTASASNPGKVALVIGNADYKESPLKNPGNDAEAMAEKLQSLGFRVILRQDLTQRQLGRTIAEFRNAIQPGGVALFYYAGHGLQVRGENFLPAVDAEIQGMDDVPNQSINVNQVLRAMEEAQSKVNLVFLDACRNNPYTRGFRSAASGLAKIEAPSGTLIHYATRPGSVASDGAAGKNGVYTDQLLKAIDAPGLPVEQVLKKVAQGVAQASASKQEPWMEGNLAGDFFFVPALDHRAEIKRLLDRSQRAFQTRDARAVVEHSRAILALEPRETTALANLAAAHLLLGEHRQAQDVAERALAIDSRHAASHNHRGMALEERGRAADALTDYRRGCELGSQPSCRNATRLGQQARR